MTDKMWICTVHTKIGKTYCNSDIPIGDTPEIPWLIMDGCKLKPLKKEK